MIWVFFQGLNHLIKLYLRVIVLRRFSWRYQLREFKSEFRVVAIDMRGYGESDLPLSSESYRFDYLVTDIKDIVEYLGEGTQDNCVSVLLRTSPVLTASQVKNKLVYQTQIVDSLQALQHSMTNCLWLILSEHGTRRRYTARGLLTAC